MFTRRRQARADEPCSRSTGAIRRSASPDGPASGQGCRRARPEDRRHLTCMSRSVCRPQRRDARLHQSQRMSNFFLPTAIPRTARCSRLSKSGQVKHQTELPCGSRFAATRVRRWEGTNTHPTSIRQPGWGARGLPPNKPRVNSLLFRVSFSTASNCALSSRSSSESTPPRFILFSSPVNLPHRPGTSRANFPFRERDRTMMLHCYQNFVTRLRS